MRRFVFLDKIIEGLSKTYILLGVVDHDLSVDQVLSSLHKLHHRSNVVGPFRQHSLRDLRPAEGNDSCWAVDASIQRLCDSVGDADHVAEDSLDFISTFPQ